MAFFKSSLDFQPKNGSSNIKLASNNEMAFLINEDLNVFDSLYDNYNFPFVYKQTYVFILFYL